MKIPMVDLVSQYKGIRKELDAAVKEVMESGWFIMGPNVTGFEEEMAAYCGTRHAVACASGTDALLAALMAIGVGPHDEVVTTPFTFVATAEVIALLGAKPVYVDIKPDTYLIDPEAVKAAITDKTRAIIPVHLFGQAADMDQINAAVAGRGITVIEDACQAVGAAYKGKRTCSLGDMGCLSFFPSKNLGAYGDGGMILTSDDDLAKQLRMIRDHGSDRRYHHAILGLNSRLDAIQAAILRVKLKDLDAWNEARKDRAALYSELLKDADVITPVTEEFNDHVFHQYSIRVKNRDALQKQLMDVGIASAVHYPIPLHLQQAFRLPDQAEGSFPVSEKTSQEILSLPMYPELKEEHIQTIVEQIIAQTG